MLLCVTCVTRWDTRSKGRVTAEGVTNRTLYLLLSSDPIKEGKKSSGMNKKLLTEICKMSIHTNQDRLSCHLV